MAAHSASCTVHINFIPKVGNVTSYITSPSGDIVLYYVENEDGTKSIVNPFTPERPAPLNLVCTSSSQNSDGGLPLQQLEVRCNNALLTFDGQGNCTTPLYAGVFKKTATGVLITGNYASPAAMVNSIITMTAQVQVGSSTVETTASYTLLTSLATRDAYHMTVFAANGNLVLSAENPQLTLGVRVLRGGVQLEGLDTGQRVAWYKMTAAGYTAVASTSATDSIYVSGQQLVVRRDGVDNYATIRAVLFNSAGIAVAQDTIAVMDTADIYGIEPCPDVDSTDLVIRETVGTEPASITFTPRTFRLHNNTATEIPGLRYDFAVWGPGSASLSTVAAPVASGTGVTSFAVTQDHCIQAGGADVDVYIATSSQS